MASTSIPAPAPAPTTQQATTALKHDAERDVHTGIHKLIDYLIADAKKCGIEGEKLIELIKARL